GSDAQARIDAVGELLSQRLGARLVVLGQRRFELARERLQRRRPRHADRADLVARPVGLLLLAAEPPVVRESHGIRAKPRGPGEKPTAWPGARPAPGRAG